MVYKFCWLLYGPVLSQEAALGPAVTAVIATAATCRGQLRNVVQDGLGVSLYQPDQNISLQAAWSISSYCGRSKKKPQGLCKHVATVRAITNED